MFDMYKTIFYGETAIFYSWGCFSCTGHK